MKRTIAAALMAFSVCCLIVCAVCFFRNSTETSPVFAQSTSEQKAEPEEETLPSPTPGPQITTLRFSATGDNLIHNGIYEQAKRRAEQNGTGGYDFSYCYDQVQQFYSDFDINWINQETLVSDTLEPSTYPCFSTPGDMGRQLYKLGFRAFNLSNNHTYDKGTQGLQATMDFWSSMPEDVITAGLYTEDSTSPVIQTVNGVRIAYLGFTEHTNGIKTPSDAPSHVIYTSELDVMQQMLEQARSDADLVVVSVHWGVEGSHSVTQAQRDLAQKMADWGADVIIGTHPHVVQTAQWLTAADGRQAFVAYSLGNFLNAQSTADTMIGMILTFTIEKTTQPDGTSSTVIRDPLFYPTVNHYDANYANIRIYLLKDYSDELAAAHGVRENFPGFTLSYITSMLQENVASEFLLLPEEAV